MKPSEIYRKAAQSMESQSYRSPYACDHIHNTVDANRGGEKERRLFVRLRDRFAKMCGKNPTAWIWWPSRDADVRVVALCFMAAIAEDEERTQKRSRR